MGGTTEPVDNATRDCVDRVLAVASQDTDNFPTLRLILDAELIELVLSDIGGDVVCTGDAGAADITYFIVDGTADLDEDVSADAAVGDGIVIVEPGGRPDRRLEDPGTTWSDVDGVPELVDELLGAETTAIEMGIPDPDRSPVSLVGRGERGRWSNPTLDLIWRFADEDAATDHVDEIQSLLDEVGVELVTIDVEGPNARVVLHNVEPQDVNRLGVRDLALWEE